MNRHAYFRQQEKNELYHHGIKGQKWGIRRYQNEDGSYTEEGKKRYNNTRQGRGNYYHDLRETAKMDIFYEKGNGDIKAGEKALKKEWSEKRQKYDELVKANKQDPVNNPHPGNPVNYDRYVNDLITNRAISSYSDMDEARRDAYAWLTESAVKRNTGNAFLLGTVGFGSFNSKVNDYKREYEKYNSIVNEKNAKKR